MGGIAGMIRYDGQSVAPNDMAAIRHLLKHRGEVRGQPIEKGVLLTFGGVIESDRAAIIYATADADLFSEAGSEGAFIPGYLSNGALSLNDLNADFAVALWDGSRQQLVCARDALGVKPLYYVHQPGAFFAFATEIKALLALQEVVVSPNEHKYREYLTWPSDNVHYSAETFYETIYSVLPGHYLQVTDSEVIVQPYWVPDLDRFSQLNRPEAYAELFNEYFTTAIEARMKAKKRVGAHLSGGLDSSSVTCVAQSLLQQQNRPSLQTFNIDTGLDSTDESIYVQSVIQQCAPEHYTVYPEPDVFMSISKVNQLFDRPDHFIIPSSFHLSVSAKAQELGCDCILTGHDGDSVITTGFDYLDQLIDAEDWTTLQLACQQVISHRERNLFFVSDNWFDLDDQAKLEKYILHTVGSEVAKRFKGQRIDLFLTALLAQKQVFGLSSPAIVRYCIQRIKDKIVHNTLIDNALRPEFKERIRPRPYLSTRGLAASSSGKSVPVSELINTTNVLCNEQLNHIGAYYGHQYSYPFFDKQVIELGLATPQGVRFDDGRGRGLIRHGLQGILPSDIINRLTKANFVEYGNLSAQHLYQATFEQYATPSHRIWQIVDQEIFAKLVVLVFDPRVPMVRKTRYNWLLSRIIYLALWISGLPRKKQA